MQLNFNGQTYTTNKLSILNTVVFMQLLISCSSQLPAPIDFKSSGSMNNVSQYSTLNSYDKDHDTIVQKIVLEDESFEDLIETKRKDNNLLIPSENNVNSDQLDYEVKAMLLDNPRPARGNGVDKEMELRSNLTRTNVLEGLNITLTNPVRGRIIKEFSPDHKAINIASSFREPVKAVYEGQILYSGRDDKFGNLLIMKLKNTNYFVAYGHLDDIIVAKGSQVLQGESIAHVGQTGDVLEPQLYIAIKKARDDINPLQYLSYPLGAEK